MMNNESLDFVKHVSWINNVVQVNSNNFWSAFSMYVTSLANWESFLISLVCAEDFLFLCLYIYILPENFWDFRKERFVLCSI